MMNTKQEKKEKTRDELLSSNKRKTIFIIALVLVVIYFIAQGVIKNINTSSDIDFDYNETEKDPGLADNIAESVKGFVQGVVELEYPFIIKFFIFLGAIYIIQVGISISGDIIQLILIIGVFIYRIVKWTSYKIRGKEYDRR